MAVKKDGAGGGRRDPAHGRQSACFSSSGRRVLPSTPATILPLEGCLWSRSGKAISGWKLGWIKREKRRKKTHIIAFNHTTPQSLSAPHNVHHFCHWRLFPEISYFVFCTFIRPLKNVILRREDAYQPPNLNQPPTKVCSLWVSRQRGVCISSCGRE